MTLNGVNGLPTLGWAAGFQRFAFLASLPDFNSHNTTNECSMIQTISTDNMTRSNINETAVKLAIRILQPHRRVYIVPARLSRQLSPDECASIRQLPDNKTGNIQLFLHIYIELPVRIKANQRLVKGVANGACGYIYHVDWRPDTEFTIQPNGAWLASNQPINIYVDVANCPNKSRFPLLPAHWPTSVMPVLPTTASVTIKGPALSIKGFPIVPAFGTTVHGVQGETRSTIAITSLRPPLVSSVDPHALYVALSRIRTRHELYWIGQPPTDDDFGYFRPSTEVLFEDNRLKRLSHTTTDLFRQLATTSTN